MTLFIFLGIDILLRNEMYLYLTKSIRFLKNVSLESKLLKKVTQMSWSIKWYLVHQRNIIYLNIKEL